MTRVLAGRHRHVFLAALLALLCARVVGAQQMIDPRGNSRIHVGPLYATPAITVPQFGVDTNVFNSTNPQRDFTFTIVPKATAWVPFARRALLTADAGASVVYFQKYGSERSINPQVRVRAEGSLGRIAPFAEGSYLRTHQRPDYEIDARVRRIEQLARIGTSVRVARKMFVEVAGTQSTVAYGQGATFNEVNLQAALNRTQRTASLSVRQELTPLTTIAVRAERGTDRFQYDPLRDSNSVRIMPGVEFKPRALVSGSAYVGVRRFTPLSSELASFNGVVASATLTYTLQSATRFTFTTDRDLTYSYERVQPYYVVTSYGLTVRRQLVGRTDVTASALHQQNTYKDLLLLGASPADLHRVDLAHLFSATIGYRFGQTTRLGFGTFYRERTSNSPRGSDYHGFSFATTLDYGL